MFKDIAHLCSLSLQVKRSRAGSTERHGQEIGGGFRLWPTWELSWWRGQSGESEGLLKDTAKKSHEEKEVSHIMLMAEFLSKFQKLCPHQAWELENWGNHLGIWSQNVFPQITQLRPENFRSELPWQPSYLHGSYLYSSLQCSKYSPEWLLFRA